MLDLFLAPQGVSTGTLSLPLWLDLASVVVGSFSGVLAAQKRGLDLVGMLALCFLCGLGGGLIRDVIMQVGNVYVLQSHWAIPVAIAAGLFGFVFPGLFRQFPHLLEWLDIFSVALFVATGTDKAIVYGLYPMACVLMGVLTGVGGGMLRDVFLGEVPRVFERSNLYALCAVAGSVTYYACIRWVGLRRPWAALACVALTVGLRRLSLRYHILSPSNVDLTPEVEDSARRVARRAGLGHRAFHGARDRHPRHQRGHED